MYDSSDASLSSGREKLEGVLHRAGVREVTVIEADPIRIDEHTGALERCSKSSWVIEMEGRCKDAIAERVGTPRRVGESSNGLPFVEQAPGDVLP
jgi:hypothetical protein